MNRYFDSLEKAIDYYLAKEYRNVPQHNCNVVQMQHREIRNGELTIDYVTIIPKKGYIIVEE